MEETEMTGNMNLNDAIIYLLNCKCTEERCSTNHCRCRKAGLNCTDLFSCSDSRELCENMHDNDGDDDEGYDDDDEDNDDCNDYDYEDEEEDSYD